MPRSRGSDVAQRPSPRAPLHLKATACSEANSVHHRPSAAERSPKVSPRGGLQERKRGTRAGDVETKLSKAQAELKKLREQLAAAEAAKLEAEQALAQAKNRIPAPAAPPNGEEKEQPPLPQDSQAEGVRQQAEEEKPEERVTSPATMDVFEVVLPTESVHIENEIDSNPEKATIEKTSSEVTEKEGEDKNEEDEKSKQAAAAALPDNPELAALKAKLLEKEKEVAILLEENMIFKTKAEEETKRIADAARSTEEDLMAKLNSSEEQLKESRAKEAELAAQLEAAEGTKATLEAEMNRLRVQSEQWRKAAEAAAAALASTGEGDMAGRRVTERCRSMDKHLGASYGGGWGSPLMAGDMDEDGGGGGGGGGRRKGTGIRMLGSLWKKTQQHHK